MDLKQNYNCPKFTSVTITPHPKKWDKEVLKAVLNSNMIKNTIKSNEKAGSDTILAFSNDVQVFPNITTSKMTFDLKSTNKNITLSSDYCDSMTMLDSSIPVIFCNGPKSLSKDLSAKIKNIGDSKNSNDSIENSIKNLNKLTSKVIYQSKNTNLIPENSGKPKPSNNFLKRLFGLL